MEAENDQYENIPSVHESSGFMMLLVFTTRAYIRVPVCTKINSANQIVEATKKFFLKTGVLVERIL